MSKEKDEDLLYKIGNPNAEGTQLVYRPISEEAKNHPKYKLACDLLKDTIHVKKK
jgi:hypothetical protein